EGYTEETGVSTGDGAGDCRQDNGDQDLPVKFHFTHAPYASLVLLMPNHLNSAQSFIQWAGQSDYNGAHTLYLNKH
ncbi:MAG: hypothetical protein HOK55_10320, partial [Gammaproteobacteria bacterium]|nr:hypothetical protein [Gammaproteobacteria bacterium]